MSPGAGIFPAASGVFSSPSLQVQLLPLILERLLKATFSEGPIKAAGEKGSSAGEREVIPSASFILSSGLSARLFNLKPLAGEAELDTKLR